MVVTMIRDGIGELRLPKWVIVGALSAVLAGSAAWYTLQAEVDAQTTAIETMAAGVNELKVRSEQTVTNQQDIALLKQQVASQADVSARIGSLESQMSRQTAILEQVLVRLESRGGGS